MKVFMYWNLRRQCWSLRAEDGPLSGRVVAHAAAVELKGCRFKVSEAGRQRVLRERCKNVHAGVVGDLVTFEPAFPTERDHLRTIWNVNLTWLPVEDTEGVPVTYNPYRVGHFESADLIRVPMTQAPRVVARGRRVTACQP